MRHLRLFFPIIALAGFVSLFTLYCVRPPDFPDEPVITFKSLTKKNMIQSINQFADSSFMTFAFTDGDGDLGNLSNDSLNVYVLDGRDGVEKFKYRIPYIEPQGTGNGIEGEITIKLNTSCCIYPDGQIPCTKNPAYPTDTLIYKVYIKDRKGNKSNVIETPPIILLCQ